MNREIADVAGLVGLLMVFVFGYFAALLPVVLEWLARDPPDVSADRRAVAGRLAGYSWLLIGIAALAALVVVVVTPLSVRVVQHLSFTAAFPTVHIGLLVLDFMLLTLFGTSTVLAVKTRRRAKTLRS